MLLTQPLTPPIPSPAVPASLGALAQGQQLFLELLQCFHTRAAPSPAVRPQAHAEPPASSRTERLASRAGHTDKERHARHNRPLGSSAARKTDEPPVCAAHDEEGRSGDTVKSAGRIVPADVPTLEAQETASDGPAEETSADTQCDRPSGIVSDVSGCSCRFPEQTHEVFVLGEILPDPDAVPACEGGASSVGPHTDAGVTTNPPAEDRTAGHASAIVASLAKPWGTTPVPSDDHVADTSASAASVRDGFESGDSQPRPLFSTQTSSANKLVSVPMPQTDLRAEESVDAPASDSISADADSAFPASEGSKTTVSPAAGSRQGGSVSAVSDSAAETSLAGLTRPLQSTGKRAPDVTANRSIAETTLPDAPRTVTVHTSGATRFERGTPVIPSAGQFQGEPPAASDTDDGLGDQASYKQGRTPLRSGGPGSVDLSRGVSPEGSRAARWEPDVLQTRLASGIRETGSRIALRLTEVVHRIGDMVQHLAARRTSSVTLELFPPNLGRLELRCREEGGQLFLQVVADNRFACAYLSRQADQVEHVVRDIGYRLAAFDVRADTRGEGLAHPFADSRSDSHHVPERGFHTGAPRKTEAPTTAYVWRRLHPGRGFWWIA